MTAAAKGVEKDCAKCEVEAIAECLLPAIRDFFESDVGLLEFEEWKKKRAEKGDKGAGG